MNSYLDLVKEYAEKHKRKNRMSLFVILLAVALVATIFGMADMELQTQQISMKKQYGSWHIGIKDMAKEQEQIVALRPQIAVSGYLESVGSRSGYTLFGKAANILGVDEALAKELGIRLEAGTWPDKGNEALITGTMARTFGIEPGDSITLERPDGDDMQLLNTAVAGDTASILKADQAGILMSVETLRRLFSPEEYSSAYYIKFRPFTNIQAEKLKIAESLGITPDSIGENAYLLAAMGQSDDPFFVGIYGTAAVLFLFVLTAAVLMITSSFQTSVTDRIRFFGMLRCLGATRKQVTFCHKGRNVLLPEGNSGGACRGRAGDLDAVRFPAGDESGIFFRYPAVWHQHPGLGGGGCSWPGRLSARLPFPGKKGILRIPAYSGERQCPAARTDEKYAFFQGR